jgi:hypothetical protein
MHLSIADGGDSGQHHVEAVEPRPAFEEMESGHADEDQRHQRQEDDLQVEKGPHLAIVATGSRKRNEATHSAEVWVRSKIPTQPKEG